MPALPGGGMGSCRATWRRLSAATAGKQDLGVGAPAGGDNAASQLGGDREGADLAARGEVSFRFARFRDARCKRRADGGGDKWLAGAGYKNQKATTGGQTHLGNQDSGG